MTGIIMEKLPFSLETNNEMECESNVSALFIARVSYSGPLWTSALVGCKMTCKARPNVQTPRNNTLHYQYSA